MIKTTATDGWYFVHENTNTTGYPAIFSRVVLWIENESGDIVGLISAYGVGFKDEKTKNRLVTPPPVEGMYIHWDEMTDADRKAALLQCRPRYMK